MAIRVNSNELISLLKISADAEVFSAISVANQMVDSLLLGKGLSTEALHQIELFLAGHVYRLSDPDISQEQYGSDARFSYAVGKRGEGLSATSWGQMAIELDTSGTLKNRSKMRASIVRL